MYCENILNFNYDGQNYAIPYRICNETKVENIILLEKYKITRHHNGFVREAAIQKLLQDNVGVLGTICILLLVGEYVLSIIQLIYDQREKIDRDICHKIFLQNPWYQQLLYDKIISYRNQYYRKEFPNKNDYPGIKFFNYIVK